MMKIGVVSDTHISHFEDLPSKLLQAFKDVDLILHAGDLVNLAILDGLRKIAPPVHAVWGNMDPPDVKRVLPEKEIIQINPTLPKPQLCIKDVGQGDKRKGGVNQFRIGLTHGAGAPFNLMKTVKEKFKNEQVDCIVYGHSHLPRNEVHQGILYFNPGSPTDKFFAPYNSYGILEVDKKIVGRIIKI